jgi:hypothetical protein
MKAWKDPTYLKKTFGWPMYLRKMLKILSCKKLAKTSDALLYLR